MLESAEETKKQYIFVSSFNVSQKDILDVVEEIGVQKWAVKHLAFGDFKANGKRRLAQGDFPDIIDLTRGGALDGQALGDNRAREFWNDRWGLLKEDLDQAIGDVLERPV
jgi:hypothetical protein